MANILGSNRETLTDALPQVLAQYPNAKVNLYGKEPRPGRKLGHVNVSGSDLEQVLAAARGAAALVRDQD
jgi:5-(carboxyamino)imidazole ribonucleotide synthase